MTSYQEANLIAMKKRIIDEFNRNVLTQKEAIKLLNMSSVGFWKLRKQYDKYGDSALLGLKRGPKPWTRTWNRTPPEIENLVEQIFLKKPYLGSKRISEDLEDNHGHRLHKNTILRILKRKGLITKPQLVQKYPELYVKDYPGEEVQIDTCFPEGRRGNVAFVGIDDFSRWVLARFGSRATEAQSIKFLYHLVRTCPFHIAAVRTDNGSEFKGKFTRACGKLGIKHIKNPAYSPERNGKVERANRTLKEECYYRYGLLYKDLQTKNYKLTQYLGYYNYQRRHSGKGMEDRTPHTKLNDYLTNLPLIQPRNINLTMVQYMRGQ